VKKEFNHCAAIVAGTDQAMANRLAFFVDYFGDRDVTTISPDDIEGALDALAQRGKLHAIRTKGGVVYERTGKPLSGSTLNRHLADLGTFYRKLRELRLTPRGFISPTRGVQRQKEGAGRVVTIDVPSAKRLVAACHLTTNKKLPAMVALAIGTGWRLGSIQSLRWRDLNLREGFADTPRTKNGTPHRAVLLPWVVAELKNLQSKDPNDFVFGKTDPKRAFKRALEYAGLPPDWTFHHCRHIAASVLAQSGASVPVIMACLNHKTPAMALRYSHLNTAAVRSALSEAWA
jgi:integrase